ncbi:hypothetical protein M8C21_017352 [Ambrosia artemisiifolia]|uniref:Uncharacterized protein n=1 Tax=Ambrosia artemisiifolia TaxID=4212 RepID=A0AAD5GGJ1_AMBAR|nr:hypothetical protein M8C21_017352 [Ambrosia artemisiifolia]
MGQYTAFNGRHSLFFHRRGFGTLVNRLIGEDDSIVVVVIMVLLLLLLTAFFLITVIKEQERHTNAGFGSESRISRCNMCDQGKNDNGVALLFRIGGKAEALPDQEQRDVTARSSTEAFKVLIETEEGFSALHFAATILWCQRNSMLLLLVGSYLYHYLWDFLPRFVLMACISGAQLSSYTRYLSKGDVALSILLTSSSTIAYVLFTPLLTGLLIGSVVPVDAIAMSKSILQVVPVPVTLGLILNKLPKTPRVVTLSLSPSLGRLPDRLTPLVQHTHTLEIKKLKCIQFVWT